MGPQLDSVQAAVVTGLQVAVEFTAVFCAQYPKKEGRRAEAWAGWGAPPEGRQPVQIGDGGRQGRWAPPPGCNAR